MTQLSTKTSFNDLMLPDSIMSVLAAMNYDTPTEIQAQAIPVAISGRDVLASSRTGSGKTAAFVIPLIVNIIKSPDCFVLILAPTRELAAQIKQVIQDFRGKNRIDVALVVGGALMSAQMSQLKKDPNIVIATPGRLQDYLDRNAISLKKFNVLVLDEFDTMLDMGFRVAIDNIIGCMPSTRQTLMFSATTSSSVINFATKYLRDYTTIAIASPKESHTNITQEVIHTTNATKYSDLLKELDKRSGSIIVFVKTKRGAEALRERLEEDEHSVDAIHGDLRQRSRDKAIKDFRNERYRILVATDIVARGIDIPHVKHVINYDMPESSEDYIHRIGRTGRHGGTGESLCLILPNERRKHDLIKNGRSGGDDARQSSHFNDRKQFRRSYDGPSNKRSDSPRRYDGRSKFRNTSGA